MFSQAHQGGGHCDPVAVSGSTVIGQHLDEPAQFSAGGSKRCDAGERMLQRVGCREDEVVASSQVRPFVGQNGEELIVIQRRQGGTGYNDLVDPAW